MKKSFITILIIFISFFSWAQWNPNTFVNLDFSEVEVSDLQAINTSDGKTWIAFYTSIGGNYNMRAQLLDVDGTKLLGLHGVPVSNQTSGSATFVFNVCVDAQNNLIIGYQYEVAGVLTAVVSKVNTDGTLPWGNGVVLGAGLSPYPAMSPTNNVYVAWNNNSPSTMYLQKISSAGTIMWTNAVSVQVGSSNTTKGQIVSHPNGDFTLVFQKKGFGINTTPYAQRYSMNGVALWAAPVQLSNLSTSGARYYSILSIGNIAYFGYYASSGFRFSAFLQKINADGTLPWGINGSPVSTYSTGAEPLQQTTNIAHASSSPYIWSVSTYCDVNQTQYGVYVQKFDTASGAVRLDSVGKEIYPISTNFDTQAGKLALLNDGPFFMSYDKNYKIYATRLNSNGDFVWTGNRCEVSSTTYTLANPKGRFAFTDVINNQAVALWSENRGTEERGYAQNIPATGILPIKLGEFLGNIKEGKVNLIWNTVSEIDCNGFEIEKSQNGTDFQKSGFVKSKSTTNSSFSAFEYSYVDANPFDKNYYRLKQLDNDGKYSYSKTIFLRMNKSVNNFTLDKIFPIPAKNTINMSVKAPVATKIEMQILNIAGKVVTRKELFLQEGMNEVSNDVQALSKGNYYIKIVADNGETITKKWMKE